MGIDEQNGCSATLSVSPTRFYRPCMSPISALVKQPLQTATLTIQVPIINDAIAKTPPTHRPPANMVRPFVRFSCPLLVLEPQNHLLRFPIAPYPSGPSKVDSDISTSTINPTAASPLPAQGATLCASQLLCLSLEDVALGPSLGTVHISGATESKIWRLGVT